MKNINFKKIIETPYFIFGVVVLLGFVIFGSYFKSSLKNISVLTNAEGITVSGTAERFVTSDNGSVSISFETDDLAKGEELALKNLTDIRDASIKYLINYGIEAKDIVVLPYSTYSECTIRDSNYWDNCIGSRYNRYNQIVKISSDDVIKIEDLSLNLNSYLNRELKDIYTNFNSVKVSIQNTQYFYSQFDSIKSEMMNEATKNAYERAEAIARSTNNHAGRVITASQGVFQVTSKDSVDTSDYGFYDTSTIEKKISAVVRVTFKVK